MKLINVDCQTTYQNIIKNVNDIFKIDDIFRMKIYLDVYLSKSSKKCYSFLDISSHNNLF